LQESLSESRNGTEIAADLVPFVVVITRGAQLASRVIPCSQVRCPQAESLWQVLAEHGDFRMLTVDCLSPFPATNDRRMRYHPAMAILDEILLAVWRQSLIENLKMVTVENETYSVRSTPRQKLKQVDFQFAGRELRALEQNPDTKSRWAQMARKGAKVMQFLERGKYVAVVTDGKVHLYARKA
jgi:hypothetical protein